MELGRRPAVIRAIGVSQDQASPAFGNLLFGSGEQRTRVLGWLGHQLLRVRLAEKESENGSEVH